MLLWPAWPNLAGANWPIINLYVGVNVGYIKASNKAINGNKQQL